MFRIDFRIGQLADSLMLMPRNPYGNAAKLVLFKAPGIWSRRKPPCPRPFKGLVAMAISDAASFKRDQRGPARACSLG